LCTWTKGSQFCKSKFESSVERVSDFLIPAAFGFHKIDYTKGSNFHFLILNKNLIHQVRVSIFLLKIYICPHDVSFHKFENSWLSFDGSYEMITTFDFK
jgi:hypothetical protein